MTQSLFVHRERCGQVEAGWQRRDTERQSLGFTLVELLVVMAIFGVVMTAIYTIFVRSNRIYISQEEVVAAQQEARAALEILGREIRMAGFIASANKTGGGDPITVAAYGGSAGAAIEVVSVDGATRTTTLAFKSDLNNDGSTDAIRYIYYWDDHATTARRNTLTRQAMTWSGGAWINDSSEQLFLENIQDFSLTYRMADGSDITTPANLANIRGVKINVTAQTAIAVEPYEGGKSVRARQLDSYIQIRNMGLS